MFANYESTKLNIVHPDIFNVLIWILLLGTLAFFYHRRPSKTKLFDLQQTIQLRGLAIIFVVVGHFWVHITNRPPSVILSGDGVALFLLLSGYGLTCSELKCSSKFLVFIRKRFIRIMFPYWLATLLFLALDYIFLKRILSIPALLQTFVGINITKETQLFDYVRWFVTFIIFWYIIFYLASRYSRRKAIIILFSTSLLVFIFEYYFLKFGWYQFFAFPMGCLIAYYSDEIKSFLFVRERAALFFGGVFILISILYKIYLIQLMKLFFPSIFIVMIVEIISLVFAFGIFLLSYYVHKSGLFNNALNFIGKYAYEIFLLHGPLMIKYSLITNTPKYLVPTMAFYFCVVLMLSYLLNVASNRISMHFEGRISH